METTEVHTRCYMYDIKQKCMGSARRTCQYIQGRQATNYNYCGGGGIGESEKKNWFATQRLENPGKLIPTGLGGYNKVLQRFLC